MTWTVGPMGVSAHPAAANAPISAITAIGRQDMARTSELEGFMFSVLRCGSACCPGAEPSVPNPELYHIDIKIKNPRSKLRGIGAARQQTGSTQQAAGNASRKRFKFRQQFRATLKLAMAVYPEAKVEVLPRGVMLHPSPPPVSPKIFSLIPATK